MKVLLVFPQKDGQTGLFIKRAFKDLGCELRVIDAKVNPHSIMQATRSFHPDLIFCSRTQSLSKYIPLLRKQPSRPIIACWNVDKRNHVSEFDSDLHTLFRNVDILYTIALGNVKQYQETFSGVVVKHLQQGCDPLTHKIEELTEEDHSKYDCDVMFAGSLASCGGMTVENQRRGLLQKISNQFNFKRYGDTDENKIYDTEANKAHLCSKIVLGHNGWPDVAISMSVRDYKVMASGGFLLTQYCKDIEKWFKIGEECEVYKTDEECLEKIEHYLNNPEERARIAKCGYDAVHANHKYIDRIRLVLEDYKVLWSMRSK